MPIHVLYLQSTHEIGGSDVSLTRLVNALDRRRFQTTAVLPADGPLVPDLERSGCRVLFAPAMRKLTRKRGPGYLAGYFLNYPRGVARLAAIIRREQPDVVHTNSLHNLYGFMAARVTRRPHVWHAREIVTQSAALRCFEVMLATRYADRIIATSEAVAAMFAGPRGYPPALRIIPNGIDADLFSPSRDGSDVRRALGAGPGTPIVGIVARLDHWKGIDTFLRAAAICRETRPDVRWAVVGGAIAGQEPYELQLAQLAASLKLGDSVRFTGWAYPPSDMPRVHAAFDLLVLASRSPEPFGLVVVEAMASGKPVVATREGGPAAICVDGETGLLVPPEDPRAMADAMLRILGDPVEARRMGQAGRRRVEERYDQRVTTRAVEQLYEEICGERARRVA